MHKLIILQIVVLTALSATSWLFAGSSACISMLLGGLSYILPTALAVFFLSILKPYPKLAGVGFVFSESLKIILALGMMTAVFVFYSEIRFIPFLLGLLAVSHIVFLLFLKVFPNVK